MAKERVHKILAKAGIASRRKAEELIREGAVTINGKVAAIGDRASLSEDAIKVSGKLVSKVEEPIYMAFYKPRNVISMIGDPEGRPSLQDYTTRIKARVFPVGRLDFTSEGLLLVTNDGEFAEKFQKRDDIPRVYHVKVKGHPEPDMLKRLERGMRIDGKKIKPHSVRVVQDLEKKTKVEVVFLESGAIDVRALFEMTGYLFERITRVSLGHLTLHGLRPGEFRHLKASQMMALLEQPELGMRLLDYKAGSEQSQARKAERRAERYGFDENGMKIVPIPTPGYGNKPGDTAGSRVKPLTTARTPAKPRVETRSPITPRSGGPRPVSERPRPSFAAKRGAPSDGSYGVFDDREKKESRRSGFRVAERAEAERRSTSDKPAFGKKRSTFGDKPKRGFLDKPSFGGGKKSFTGEKRAPRSSDSGGRPSFGSDKPRGTGKPMQGFTGFRKGSDVAPSSGRGPRRDITGAVKKRRPPR